MSRNAHRIGVPSHNAIDIPIGTRFGHRVVISGPTGRKPGRYYIVRCDCGSEQEIFSATLRLKNGRAVVSCGCVTRSKTHCESRTRLYTLRRLMIDRCDNPRRKSYRYYGGRGITVCQEWRESYEAFRDWAHANGYRDDLEIDRIDNDKGYFPENCRWVTRAENNLNKSNIRMITAFGESKVLDRWLDDPRCVVGEGLLRKRIKAGWDAERAITTRGRSRRMKHISRQFIA